MGASRQNFSFVAESTLGKLAKWLRLAGFDTLFDHQAPDSKQLVRLAASQRIILTRTQRVYRFLPAFQGILILHNKTTDQIRHVIDELEIQPWDLKPLTLCTLCNIQLKKQSKDTLARQVPDFIRQCHTSFLTCPQCNRTYWAGSHCKNIKTRMQSWFSSSEK
ncbi:MAG: hypothetical protein GY874_06275 [Desulfobacteraceae bacterium]|nr:hypothetical protein [Desulfobacteraceae bacterium]